MVETFLCSVLVCGAQLMFVEWINCSLLKIILYLFFYIFNISLSHLSLIFILNDAVF